MPKQTGWVIVATEGATIDKRIISKQWIQDMADTYSASEYTALIWPEHFRSTWGPFEGKNWGTVDELKAAVVDGALRLFAKLTGNDYLLAANKDGQKLFMSIEPDPDYKGTGKAYLTGLAVTDSPASTGTTRLKFSVGERSHDVEVSQLEALLSTDFIKEETTEGQAKENGLFAALQNLLNKFKTPEPATDKPEVNPMDKEQFAALMGKIDGIDKKVGELEGKVNEFSKKPEAVASTGADTGADTGKEKPADKPEEKQAAITAEQFSQLTQSITSLTAKVDGMDTQFKKLAGETAGQEPDKAGQGQAYAVV
ncbi:GPO family capsid scaffolding protein [Rheinheimera marina]|uniref:GPO family capsid scaffolding protein n=1 Tax=Rheinheimera marina TaxID=1774958 RepID=A0ABV9JJS6_9GAMM